MGQFQRRRQESFLYKSVTGAYTVTNNHGSIPEEYIGRKYINVNSRGVYKKERVNSRVVNKKQVIIGQLQRGIQEAYSIDRRNDRRKVFTFICSEIESAKFF